MKSDLYVMVGLCIMLIVLCLYELAISALLCLFLIGVVAFLAGAGYWPWKGR